MILLAKDNYREEVSDMDANKNLNKARNEKNDEFYTHLRMLQKN